MSKIILVLLKNGFFTRKNHRGESLTKSLQELGPSFIKLGQTLSVRPDIIGEKLANDLSQLQDKIPPFDINKARDTIEKELEGKINEIFETFDENPIAAASIAQVHKAVTKEGLKVAVKILRPDVEKRFKKDIKLFYAIAKFIKTFKKAQRLRPNAVVKVFEDSVKKELDLRMEAAAASELKENCKNDEGIFIPTVYWRYTSAKVLTTSWVDGIGISKTEELIKAGHNLEEITKRLSIAFLNQTYRDGFFHADIHPGNLFVNKNGEIAFIDFGIMGRLDYETKVFVAEILRGFINRDYAHVAKVHFQAGYVPKHKSELDFMLACRAIGEPIMGLASNEVSIAKLLSMLFKVTEDFEMQTQPQLILFQKTMVLVEGVGQKLYPSLNMWEHAEGWIKNWAKDNISLKARLKNDLKNSNDFLHDLPKIIRKIDDYLDYKLKSIT